ncbi:lipase maturation factor 2-like [Montipora foliosa]|uniref:lipase maturation factor 2-like n=1 Tax=Montipora foliosa TaxID=591990 RepID=UPI0035F0FC4F
MAGYGKQILVRNTFLWLMSVIYLFAFSSLYVQIPGLYGRNGVLPAKLALSGESSSIQDNFWQKPTLLWLTPKLGLDTETGMEFLCLLGMLLSLLAMSFKSWRDSITFFMLWFLYYSLYQVGQTFVYFQWDILLMETGFLTILVSPLKLFKSSNENRHHDNITLWLVKWLAFRLMFCSGIVKLSSRCPTWWGLTALDWHYESQCIPTPLAWYAHQLPKWFQRLSIVLTYVILIALSWLFFIPVRSLRIFSFYSQIFFQVLIILTGNYNFFNLLAIALLLSILDDEHLTTVLPSWLGSRKVIPTQESAIIKVSSKIFTYGTLSVLIYWMVELFALEISSEQILKSKITFSKAAFFDAVDQAVPVTIWIGTASLGVEIIASLVGCLVEKGKLFKKLWSLLQWAIFSFAALGMFAISLVPYTDISHKAKADLWPVIHRWRQKTDSFELVNSYGLFRSMTGVGGRPEVVIEGSNDLDGPWKEYHFHYKPGNLSGPPPVVAPHQPRLDWQIWFAALGSYEYNPWFVHMVFRLLQGKQEVLDLLAKNPFPRKPPIYIRAQLYKYHYTELPSNISSLSDVLHNNRLVKNWWWRERVREYLPILAVNEPSLINWLSQYGLAKDNPWPERPSGRIYRAIKYLRSIVRTLDAVRFMWALFACGVMMRLFESQKQ